MQLPKNVDEVTNQWLSDVLSQRGERVVVESHTQLQIIHGTATKFRLRLRYAPQHSDGLPETMWLKIGFEPHSGFMEETLGAYRAEVLAYSELVPPYKLNTPECFFAKAEGGQAALLLEDLTPRNVTFNSATTPLSAKAVSAGLDTLASLHGQSWQDPRIIGCDRLEKPLGGNMRKVFDDFVRDADKYFSEPRGYSVPVLLHDSNRLAAGMRAYIPFAEREPTCLLHGDTHVGNWFSETDGRVSLLDWQMVCAGHWSHDFAYFIVSALDMPDRRAHERDLLAHYLQKLGAEGGDPPSFDEAWQDYRRAIYYGFLVWLGNADVWQPAQVNLAAFARFGSAMLDHDTYGALGV